MDWCKYFNDTPRNKWSSTDWRENTIRTQELINAWRRALYGDWFVEERDEWVIKNMPDNTIKPIGIEEII